MADQNIKFKLTTEFVGEGITKANNAIKGLSKLAADASNAARQIGASLGMLEGPAGKAAQAVTGVITAVKSMGLLGGIVAAAQFAISKVFEKMKDDLKKVEDAAKAAADAAGKNFHNAVKAGLKDLQDNLDVVGKKADANAKSLDKIVAAAKRVNEAMGKAEGAKNAAEVVEIDLKKLSETIKRRNEANEDLAKAEKAYYECLEDLRKAQTPDERRQAEGAVQVALKNRDDMIRRKTKAEEDIKIAEAEANVEKALKERENAMRQASADLDSANANEKNANDRIQTAKKNLESATNAAKEAEEKATRISKLHTATAEEKAQADKIAKDAAELLARRTDELNEAEANLKVAHEGVKEASYKWKASSDKSKIAVDEAKNALTELKRDVERQRETAKAMAATEEEATKKQEELNSALERQKIEEGRYETQKKEMGDRLQAMKVQYNKMIEAGVNLEKKWSDMDLKALEREAQKGDKARSEYWNKRLKEYWDQKAAQELKADIEKLSVEYDGLKPDIFKAECDSTRSTITGISNEITDLAKTIEKIAIK